jgi:Uma2 family endonuclease
VDCSNPAGESHFVDEPRMIVEVLSRDTERIDRGEKLRNYQEISALEVYALVDQFHIAVTVYRRSDGNWSMEFFAEKEDVLQFPEIECALPMTAIYERTHLVR